MNHKVLLADDSLTIQKVIKITLANQPYDITDCSSEEELFTNLQRVKPQIVFLDFNLSEKYTGYELTTKIKSELPTTKVLLLLGTFDSIDEAAMEKCGASEKIVKPFDSNRFIAICKQLVETFVDEAEIKYPEPKKPAPLATPNPDDQWKVSHTPEPKLSIVPDKPLDNSFPQLNALEREVTGWGMSIPSVINDSKAHEKLIDLPPVIGEKITTPSETKTETTRPDIRFPESNDLDYPDMGVHTEEPVQEVPAVKPKYLSEGALMGVDPDVNTMDLELEKFPAEEQSNVSAIEAQIRDEVEEDLWRVDEFEDLKREVSNKIEEVKNAFQPSREAFDDSLFQPPEESKSTPMHHSHDEALASLRGEMEVLVKKYVKEYMDQLFQKNVEKVSWEVIPDLAENLIRQELSKISHKILNEN